MNAIPLSRAVVSKAVPLAAKSGVTLEAAAPSVICGITEVMQIQQAILCPTARYSVVDQSRTIWRGVGGLHHESDGHMVVNHK